jgi:hypothetical protein
MQLRYRVKGQFVVSANLGAGAIMIESIYGIGLAFGLLAGLFFGLPTFVVGLLIAIVAVTGLGIWAEQGFLQIAFRALVLAVTLQVSYVLGLVAQAASISLRRRLKQQEQKPSPREVE